MRKLPPHNPAIYPALDQMDFARVVPARPRAEPYHGVPVRGLADLLQTSFSRNLTVPTLSFANSSYSLTSCRGLEPHEFAPMLGVHKALQLTPLRSEAELGRMLV